LPQSGRKDEMMDAKNNNLSQRLLFINGGRLDVLLGKDEGREFQQKFQLGRGRGLEIIKECPCGCGLKDVCENQQKKVKALNDEIPF